jgi:hypothetical protein
MTREVEGSPTIYDNNLSSYYVPGGLFFNTETEVKQGRFKISTKMPNRVNYGDSLNRIIAFAQSNANTPFPGYAKGLLDTVVTYGSMPPDTTDSVGPSITFILESKTGEEAYFLSDGIYLDSTSRLKIVFTDRGGIYAQGSEPGEGLFYEIDGITIKKRFVSAFVQQADRDSNWNESQRGFVYLDLMNDGILEKISPGRFYFLKVFGEDQNNNRSDTTLRFSVLETDTNLVITHVFCHPNPFKSGTRIYWNTSYTGLVDVKVRIYSPSGQLIWLRKWSNIFSPIIQPITWGGLDQEGVLCANNVYFCKLDISTRIHERIKRQNFLLRMMLVR